jgi:hypothetical protein
MTRVNLIEPADLSNPHLLAEYREITRIYALAHRWGEHDGGRYHPNTSWAPGMSSSSTTNSAG